MAEKYIGYSAKRYYASFALFAIIMIGSIIWYVVTKNNLTLLIAMTAFGGSIVILEILQNGKVITLPPGNGQKGKTLKIRKKYL